VVFATLAGIVRNAHALATLSANLLDRISREAI
jgi:hypothetical protein